MVAELNEIWGLNEDKCDKFMEHIKNCPECQKKIKKMFQQQPQRQQPQQVVENFQQIKQKEQPKQIKQKVQQKEPQELVDILFEYSDIILIGLTIYLVLKAL